MPTLVSPDSCIRDFLVRPFSSLDLTPKFFLPRLVFQSDLTSFLTHQERRLGLLVRGVKERLLSPDWCYPRFQPSSSLSVAPLCRGSFFALLESEEKVFFFFTIRCIDTRSLCFYFEHLVQEKISGSAGTTGWFFFFFSRFSGPSPFCSSPVDQDQSGLRSL